MLGIIMLLGLLMLITIIHELGHLVVAKLSGVKVEIFSIGFGLKLFGFKIGETEYRISLIPFGGYCEIKEYSNSNKEENNTLYSKRYLIKVAIALAGVIANLLTAFGILFMVSYFISKSFILAFEYSINFIYDIILVTIISLKLLFTGKLVFKGYLLNTVNIIGQYNNIIYWLLFFVIFSITVAIFNLIPFPSLDGSLPFLSSLEKIFDKKKAIKINNIICKIGFIILIILTVLCVIIGVL